MDTVEGSTPSEAEKVATHGVRAGDMKATATLDNFWTLSIILFN
jgi:hypothetical protein